MGRWDASSNPENSSIDGTDCDYETRGSDKAIEAKNTPEKMGIEVYALSYFSVFALALLLQVEYSKSLSVGLCIGHSVTSTMYETGAKILSGPGRISCRISSLICPEPGY